MGTVVDVCTLEEMCGMMCDNVLPEPREKWWYFTFGSGQPNEGHYVKFYGTFESAREKMEERYEDGWGFQYSEEEWRDMEADPGRPCPMETELKAGADGR